MDSLLNETENSGPEPLKCKQKMRKLLEHFDTQKELADHLSVSNPTVVYWKKQHDFTVTEPKNGIYFREHKEDGHFQLRIRGETVIPEHALTALAGGSDPHNVFADNAHIHHINGCSYDNRPENVIPVTNKMHQIIHQNEEWASENGLLKANTNCQD